MAPGASNRTGPLAVDQLRLRLIDASNCRNVRDGGVAHALLGIPDDNALSGHPVVGARWEGFVIENLIAAAPDRTGVEAIGLTDLVTT